MGVTVLGGYHTPFFAGCPNSPEIYLMTGSICSGICKEIAENGPALMRESLNLFLGVVSDVNTFAQVTGGGGSYNNGRWGRRKDDDDALWGRRCVNMAKRYLRASRKKERKLGWRM